MAFFRKKIASSLSEELLERVWDVSGRLKQLESTLDERLDELSKRYRRAEQSEKRLDEKRDGSDCQDCGDEPKRHPYIESRIRRREKLNHRLKESVS